MAKAVIINPKARKSPKEEEKDEGKTLFEHLGLAGGNKAKNDTYDKFVKMLKSVAVMVIIGYLLGTIIDIMLKTNIYALIFAIVMLIVWILKVFGLSIPSRKKD